MSTSAKLGHRAVFVEDGRDRNSGLVGRSTHRIRLRRDEWARILREAKSEERATGPCGQHIHHERSVVARYALHSGLRQSGCAFGAAVFWHA